MNSCLSYRNNGNSFVSNDGVTVKTVTDDFGRTTTVKTQKDDDTAFYTSYEYAAQGSKTTNDVSKLTQRRGSTDLVSYEYEYDLSGNIKTISENGTGLTEYEYDGGMLSREMDKTNHTYTFYSYDNGGNLTNVLRQTYNPSTNLPTSTISDNDYEYDGAWKDKLVEFNNQTITYDAMGNPLQYRDGMTFTWERGRILSSVTVDNTTLEMRYDSNGMRTQKGNVHYYYDSSNNLVALVKGNVTLFFYYDENGSPTSFSYNGIMQYYIKNLQGDIVKIVNSSGNTVASYEYNVWGELLSVKNGNGENFANTNNLAFLNPLRYRGYVYDDETGLYYLQSRYYDPVTCRFLNADVYCDTLSGTPLSTNMFAYAENVPLMKYDKNGKDAWWIQSPNSVNTYVFGKAGHTSLLIQEKKGYWWYFYWSGETIQMLFIGTTTLKDIDKKVRRTISIYNKKYGLKISYDENYTQCLKFPGNFTKSLSYVRSLMSEISFKDSKRIYTLRFNPDISNDEYNQLIKLKKVETLNDYLLTSSHKYYKGGYRPYSWVIVGNERYKLKKRNCMQESVTALLKGNFNPYNNYYKMILKEARIYPGPNRAFEGVGIFDYLAKMKQPSRGYAYAMDYFYSH